MKIQKHPAARGLAGFFLLLFILALSGCRGGTAVDENFLGVDLEGGSDQVVVTVTASASLSNFAAAVEAKYPDIRLVQDSYMGEFRINEHVARVNNQDWGDLVLMIAGHIPKADMSGMLMDLSTQSFPSSYNSNALQMDNEGHIYLIPGPLNFNCNIYNKSLFDENGWDIPKNYEEWISLCQTINQTGIQGYQYVLNDTSIQSYQIYNYCVLSALDTLTSVEGQTWHNQLMAGKAVSLEPMKVSFQNLQRLVDVGVVRAEDMEVTNKIRIERMVNRQAAITPGAVSVLNQLNASGTDEYRFMPHFSMTDGNGWLLNLGYYFGANQELRQPQNEKKLEAAMRILEFVASAEGQQALIADELGMVPTTRGAALPSDPAFDEIMTQMESGRYVMRPTYDMFTTVLETEIASFIRGETTSDDILTKCQVILEEGAPKDQAIGQATADFSVLQTGQLKADALRSAAGTDVALIGMAEANCYAPVNGTRSKLYEGPVTGEDVTRISQNLTDESPLYCRVSITGAELLKLLDDGATSAEEQSAGHASSFHPYAVSGLTLCYDLDGAAGARVTEVKLQDGKELEPEAVYTLAFLEGVLPEKYQVSSEKSEQSMTEAFSDYIAEAESVAPDTDRVRFR